MRLPSISDRLAEQFVKPLAVNRMRASCRRSSAIRARTHGHPPLSTALRAEIDEYLNTTNGSGIDVPAWLRTLEREIDRLLDDGSVSFEAGGDRPLPSGRNTQLEPSADGIAKVGMTASA